MSLQEKIITTSILTPPGPMLAGASPQGICLLEFIDPKIPGKNSEKWKKLFKAELCPGDHELFKPLQKELTEYFDGKRKAFDIPLDITGTDFQKKVWNILTEIPYGRTWSYQEQAAALGNPKAVRAVARANGENRISLIIPCHRVIGKNGSLTGYAGGLGIKEYLLNLEKMYSTQ